MKTIFYPLTLALLCLNFSYSNAQSPAENLDKYWNYRDRLRKDFLKIGTDNGESIPMSARSIGFAYEDAPDNANGDKPSRIYYQDATIYLGHYLAVLATEAKLLLNSYNASTDVSAQQALFEQLTATKNELYYAIQTVNRLDRRAEEYLSQGQNTESPEDLNGLLMRDDVHVLFHLNFENDYSEIFNRECDFIRTHSDSKPVDVWAADGPQIAYNGSNVMSLDQITSILMGLKTVHTLLPSMVVQPTPEDMPLNLREEAKSIVFRIIDYVMNDVDGCTNNCKSFNIRNWDGMFRPAGYDLTFAAPFIVKLGLDMGHPELTQMQLNDELQDMRVAFQMHPQELLDIFLGMNNVFGGGDLSCQDNIEDMLEDLIVEGEPATVASIKFWALVALVDEIEEQSLDLSVGGNPCITITDDIQDALNTINIDIEGVVCDNLIEGFINSIIASPLLRLSIDNVPVRLLGMIDGSEICLETIGFFSQSTTDGISDVINDDNVHIFLELATSANKWSSQYINYIGTNSGMHWYGLLHGVLHNAQAPYSILSPSSISADYLNTAPCLGPWDSPDQEFIDHNLPPEEICNPSNYIPADGTSAGWVGANRLFHPGNSFDGICDASFRGEFSGLDYMLYFNLYRLLWPEEFDGIIAEQTCRCKEEFTSFTEALFPIEITRKFPDYKAKGIPIESYLTHDFTAFSQDAIVDVKNDLIICSPVEEEVIELTIRDNALMNLYNGNTITVKKGNKLIIRDGGVLFAGMDDTSFPGDNTSYTAPEIFLEENAEMIIENYASIKIEDGLLIHLKEGSIFKMIDSQCTSVDWGITFESDGGEIIFIRSGAVSRSNFSTGTNLKNTNVEISKSQLTLLENGSNFWQTENCNIDINSNSTLQLTTLLNMYGGKITNATNSTVTLKHGYLDLYNDAKMYWNGGNCKLHESDSHIKFDNSEFYIAPNATFAPSHDGVPSGYIEFAHSYDINFFSGAGSVFSLVGDGNEDLMLKINNYANLWNASTGDADIIFEKCKVDLTDHAGIWLGQRFSATEVNFVDVPTTSYNGGNIHVWYNDCNVKKSNFESVRITGHDSKMNFYDTKFFHKSSGVEARGGSYKIDFCSFEYCHIESFSLEIASQISKSTFRYCDGASPGISSGDQPQVYDESSVELKVAESTFLDGRTGVMKYGGKLKLACNSFTNMSIEGVKVSASYLNMSSTSAAGFNIFENVRTCIELVEAEGIDLYRGYNYLSGYNNYCIHGTMNKICQNSCETEIDAQKNYWGAPSNTFPPSLQVGGLYTPDMSAVVIEVYGSDGPAECYQIICTSGCPGCTIHFKDNSPNWKTCAIGVPVVRNTKSDTTPTIVDPSMKYVFGGNNFYYLKDQSYELGNPLINTTTFNNVTLDSALVYSALHMELYDSLGNDLNAVSLFHEVLSSPLDRTNSDIRWRMEWGRYNMKTALENMFLNAELNELNNTETFEIPVQQYVDVLNLMTDTLLTDSTYKEQFYLEIDKGQLFRTLGKPEMARYIYQHLDDCDLDSLEQTRLNNWLAEVDLEISIREQYLQDQISPDSIDYSVDSSAYTTPIVSETNDYYFGLWINSPQSVTFVACGNPGYKSYKFLSNGFQVFPNPTTGEFYLSVAKEGNYSIKITELTGRTVFDQTRYFDSNNPISFNADNFLSGGQYVISLTNKNITLNQKLIVN